jgi:hypothetical protein
MAKVLAKTKVIPRVDPDEDFSDVDGDIRTEFALDESTMDPTRHYHMAHNSRDDIGQYTGGPLGYVVEHVAAGGVKFKQGYGLVNGEPLTKRDHVLVSCDKAMWEKRQRFEIKKNADMRGKMFRDAQSPIDLRRE